MLRHFAFLFVILFLFWFTEKGYTQEHFNPEGETYILLIDGTTRLYDPSVDYGKLGLTIAPDANFRNPLPKEVRDRIMAGGKEGCTFDINYVNFTPQAQAAFQYAVNIWQALLNSPVPIKTYASWEPMGTGVLGSSTRMGAYRDFSGAPLPNVWYPVALAEALYGSVLNGTNYDIYVRFNSDFQWYLGTDGNTPSGQYDFVSVVLHELCHGLGFYSSFAYSSGTGYWGAGGYPYVWDVHTKNGNGDSLLNQSLFPNYSTALGTQITSNNIFYTNRSAVANNGGAWVSIYAPTTWSSGSSMSHVGEVFRNTRNSLMVYSISAAYSQHSPGPVAIGMLRDFGWSVTNMAPVVVSPMPDFALAAGSSNVFYGKLLDYFYDVNQYRINNFQFTANQVTANVVNDSLFLTVPAGVSGTEQLIVTAIDTGSLSVSDTVSIEIVIPQATVPGMLYAAGTSASGGFVYFNTTNGAATNIGLTGFSDIKGLSVEPVSHEMYGLFVASTYAVLLRMDASTGRGFNYRVIRGANYRGMAFDNSGDLFVHTTTGILYKVNLNTGDTLRIGSTGISNLQNIAVNPLTNQLYGLALAGGLYRIDKSNASSVLIGSTGFGTGRAIAFDAEGRLFGLSGGSNQPLYRIDTTTAIGTLIGNTGKSGLSAMAVRGSTVDVAENSAMIKEFSLLPNYPNPFNPSTVIGYQIANNSQVSLKIYNMLGQEVRTLVNTTQSAGQYKVQWDGKDNSGKAVSSGIYFYRLEAGSFVKTRKMMLMK